MARTYLSGDNSRGGQVSGANATFAHLRGWEAGVRVEADRDPKTGRDIFRVFRTSGSNGARSDGYLGTVRDTPKGPQWRSREAEQRAERRRERQTGGLGRDPGPDAMRWAPEGRERQPERQPQRNPGRSRGRSR
jgi:hypothetical protein